MDYLNNYQEIILKDKNVINVQFKTKWQIYKFKKSFDKFIG